MVSFSAARLYRRAIARISALSRFVLASRLFAYRACVTGGSLFFSTWLPARVGGRAAAVCPSIARCAFSSCWATCRLMRSAVSRVLLVLRLTARRHRVSRQRSLAALLPSRCLIAILQRHTFNNRHFSAADSIFCIPITFYGSPFCITTLPPLPAGTFVFILRRHA